MRIIKTLKYDQLSEKAQECARLDYLANSPDYGWYSEDYKTLAANHPEFDFSEDETTFDLEYNYAAACGSFRGVSSLLRECFPSMNAHNMAILREAFLDFDDDSTAGWFNGHDVENIDVNYSAVAEFLEIGYGSIHEAIYDQTASGPLPASLSDWLDEKADEFAEFLTNKGRAISAELLRLLHSDYDYLTSDEYIAEILRANDYDFLPNGALADWRMIKELPA